jgi:hypothetical protein
VRGERQQALDEQGCIDSASLDASPLFSAPSKVHVWIERSSPRGRRQGKPSLTLSNVFPIGFADSSTHWCACRTAKTGPTGRVL